MVTLLKINRRSDETMEKGFATLYLTLLILAAMFGIAVSIAFVTTGQARMIGALTKSSQAYYAAEAGIEDAAYRVKKKLSYTASYTLAVASAQTEVTVTSAGASRTIESRGSYRGDTRALRAGLELVTVEPQFFFGAQVGEGGVVMGQNSSIEGAGGIAGNIYSNGSVVGGNGATITGDITVATGISEDPLAQQTTCASDQIFGQADPVIDMAQGFQPSASKPLAKVSLRLKKVGSPGDRTVFVASDAGGSPAQTALASGTLSASLVTTSYGWADVTFASPPSLVAGTTYWIVVDAAKSASKYWVWCKDAGGYASGSPKASQSWDHDPWTSVAGDLAFKTYLGAGVSSLADVTVLGSARVNTITTSKVCGDAYYQTIDASSASFLASPASAPCPAPLTPGTGFGGQADPPVENLPISQANIDEWKEDAVSGGVITGNCGDNGAAECVVPDNGTLPLGPKKIIGSITLTKKQTLVVTGTLYITGAISLDSGSGATIRCDQAFAASSCLIVSDSWMHIKNNATLDGSGTAGSYLLMLTTLAGCNGGAETPPCTHHNAAIDIHNNAAGAIFYAAGSMVNLHNGVTVTEVTAAKLSLDQNAIVRYEQGLANAQFSSGPGASFRVLSWQEIE